MAYVIFFSFQKTVHRKKTYVTLNKYESFTTCEHYTSKLLDRHKKLIWLNGHFCLWVRVYMMLPSFNFASAQIKNWSADKAIPFTSCWLDITMLNLQNLQLIFSSRYVCTALGDRRIFASTICTSLKQCKEEEVLNKQYCSIYFISQLQMKKYF